MFFRLVLYRLKAGGLRLLLGLVFGVVLFSLCSAANIIDPARSLHAYSTHHQTITEQEARRKGMVNPDPAARSDVREGYRTYLRKNRSYVYACLVTMVNDLVPLVANALAVILLTGIFRKKRLEPPLAAGYSRGRVFLSLTGGYFLCVLLVWVLSSVYLLDRYCVEFAPEEREFFLVTQLTWFCAFLWHASVAYLFAMLLRGPLTAFAATAAVWLILGSTVNTPNVLPSCVIENLAIPSWEPGPDLWPLLRTDLVAAGFFVLVILIAWLAFRKRDQI